MLVEKGEVVSENKQIVTHFNNYLTNIAKELNIKRWCISNKLSDDPLVYATLKYENHPRIIKMRSSAEATQLFDVSFVNSVDIPRSINSLDPTKNTKIYQCAILTKIIKLAKNLICKDLENCINEWIKQKNSKRAKCRKYNAYIHEDDPLSKINHRSMSILPTVSKFSKDYYLVNYNVFQVNSFCLCSLDSGKFTIINIPLQTFSKNGRGVLMHLTKLLEYCQP